MRRVEALIAQRLQVTWLPLLPIVVADEAEARPGPDTRCMPWKLDTGCALSCAAWRYQLKALALAVSEEHLRRDQVGARYGSAETESLACRRANLWLYSNIPSLRARPLRLPLPYGLPFKDRPHPSPAGA